MFSRLIGLLLIVGCGLKGLSQQNDHFIYLQSDNKQPFYVKLLGSSSALSSSGSGYLILPKVAQGQFSFVVGFPDSAYPEQHFICSVTGDKDKGYLLKRFPDKGWALYDLQELTITYAGQSSSAAADSINGGTTVPTASPIPAATAPASAGSVSPIPTAPVPAAPASVVTANPVVPVSPGGASGSDTVVKAALTDSAVPRNVAAAPKTAAPKDAFGDILVAVTHDSTLRDIKNTKKTVKPKQDSAIALVSRQTTDTGVQLVYTDRQASGSVDTVQVLIPASTPDTAHAQASGTNSPPVAVVAPVVNASGPVTAVSTGTAVPVTTVTDSALKDKAIDTTHAFDPSSARGQAKAKDTSNYVVPVFKQGSSQDTVSGVASGSTAAQPLAAGFGVLPASSANPALANSDCKRMAGDEDFARLRKKMTSESDVDRMIEIARKGFKKTCFTTEQVRTLSFLFLQEDGRYKFLEEAYPFVSDSGNFKNLQAVFSSAYYINRFKALVQR